MQREDYWNQSYRNKQNYLFYPDEMIIRFLSLHYRKQVGVNEFVDITPWNPRPKALDAGCGIGRHVHLLDSYGFEAYGVDGSSDAITVAHSWMRTLLKPTHRIIQGSLQTLPFETEFFDCIVSHAVLDSMSFDDAVLAIGEIDRVLSKSGMFYFDLLRDDHRTPSHEFSGEIVVATSHEFGTIQSYFGYEKILRLIDKTNFQLVDVTVVARDRLDSQQMSSRWHLVCRKA